MAQQLTLKKNTAQPTSSTTSVAGEPLFHYAVDGTKAVLYMGYAAGDDKHVRVGQLIENNDNLGTSDDKLATQGNIKAYVDAQAGTDIVTYENLSANSDIGFGSSQVPAGNLTAPLASPAFTGNPTVPTQSAGNDSTRIATTAYADTAISNLVDSSPAALNTLNELAAALGDDASFSTTITNSIATKAPIADPTFTGEIGIGSVNVSETELGLLEGLTSSTAELNTLDGFDGDVDDLKYAKDLNDTGVTAAEFDHLDGVTSGIQAQIDSKGTGTVSSLSDLSVTSSAAELNALDGYTGSVTELNYLDTLHATGVTSTEYDYLDGVSSNIQSQLDAKQASGSYQANDAQLTILAAMSSGTANAYKDLQEAEVQILDGCTSTTAELNILDGVTATAAELNILDGVTSTAAELNILDGVTSTAAELNILDGCTSTVAELNILDGVTATAAELNTLDGFDGDVDDLKYAKDLNDTGVTAAEYDYLDGVTSNIQTQFSGKVGTTGNETIAGNKTFSGTTAGITATMVGLGNVENTALSTSAIGGGTYNV